MLQLQTNNADISRICKLLVKYSVNATISNTSLTLDGEISDEILSKLCEIVEVDLIQNFTSDKHSKTNYTYIKSSHPLTTTSHNNNPLIMHDIDCDYGDIYMCDFGEPYAHEQGYIRPAIVVRNHKTDINYFTTIVVPCTSKSKKPREGNYSLILSPDTMINYNPERVSSKKNTTVLTEKIREVDKSRLLRYMGTLKPETMQELQDKINLVIGKFPY